MSTLEVASSSGVGNRRRTFDMRVGKAQICKTWGRKGAFFWRLSLSLGGKKNGEENKFQGKSRTNEERDYDSIASSQTFFRQKSLPFSSFNPDFFRSFSVPTSDLSFMLSKILGEYGRNLVAYTYMNTQLKHILLSKSRRKFRQPSIRNTRIDVRVQGYRWKREPETLSEKETASFVLFLALCFHLNFPHSSRAQHEVVLCVWKRWIFLLNLLCSFR